MELVDESFGPARALRAMGTARGQRQGVAHRLPPFAGLSPTNSTGPTIILGIRRKEEDTFGSLMTDLKGQSISVAELLILNRLLDHSVSAWRAWSGPAGDRHDFRSGDHSLEVKATHRLSASAITINGLDQLDAPVGGTLHLLRIVLEPVSGGALSISDLGRSALSKADKPDRVRGLLTAVGCRDVDSESWNRTSFRIAAETLYEIRPGFPRLISSMLAQGTAPHGVHEVSYRIDLSVAETFRCDAAAYRLLESRLCQ